MRLTTWPGIIIDISKDLLWAIMTKNCGKWPMRRKMFVFRICIGSANIFSVSQGARAQAIVFLKLPGSATRG
jgi:hypothetical protein